MRKGCSHQESSPGRAEASLTLRSSSPTFLLVLCEHSRCPCPLYNPAQVKNLILTFPSSPVQWAGTSQTEEMLKKKKKAHSKQSLILTAHHLSPSPLLSWLPVERSLCPGRSLVGQLIRPEPTHSQDVRTRPKLGPVDAEGFK